MNNYLDIKLVFVTCFGAQCLVQLRIWNRTKSNAIKFADEAQKSLAKVKVCETVAEAARGADVVLTVTMSPKPVLCGDWLKEGAFVCSECKLVNWKYYVNRWNGLYFVYASFNEVVGACTAAWRETDDAVMRNSLVVVDSRQSAEKESGDIIQSGVSNTLGGTLLIPLISNYMLVEELHNKPCMFMTVCLGFCVC